ncbi:aminotransferase class I/II-fold pyridoxal phosphate-dependent enzyme [uncultured Ilyobacter sp.]|uniref:pyridoxal phosphate-dependent aminotransferase n=1 Tax=uncultured Ilyobacter sp. TaxID=544433 RepID=UPI0029C93381|nr:aminotransferase class I/II-fold pyridoxal phosphate-dependent enzyme [uncultured Ilyobacter sp.]
MKTLLTENSKDKMVEDTVFKVVAEAMNAVKIHGDKVVNATLGSLSDENGNLVTMESVWEEYKNIDVKELASYSASFRGEADYIEAIEKWVFQGVKKEFFNGIVATPGGSGAVSTTFKNYLGRGETVLLPEIGWGPYWLMAKEFGFETEEYSLFDGNAFNMESFKCRCKGIMEKQGKILAVINDPCHNPTGYSLTTDEWKNIIDFMEELSKKGPVILLDDIAYMDFSKERERVIKVMEELNDRNKNFLVVFAFSISKTLTAYGLRVGAQVAVSSSQEVIDDFIRANEISARAVWSNIPKGGMKLFARLILDKNKKEAVSRERNSYIELLKERSDIFISEAHEVGLPVYPYREGFFVTIKVEDVDKQKEIHKKLKENLIYTILVNKGIRVAVCSLPKRKIKGLAKRIKEAFLDE